MKLSHAFVLALTLATGMGIGVNITWSQTRPSPSTQKSAEAVTRYQKAYELYQRGDLNEAQRENNEALRLDPQLQEALTLRDILNSQIPAQSGRPGSSTRPTQLPIAQGELLTEQQFARIRMYELTSTELRDTRSMINGVVPRQTLEQFWDRIVVKDPRQKEIKKTDRDNFLNPSRFRDQVQMIKDYKAEQYYGDVKLFSDPAVLATFRNRVQPYLLQNCATAKCHGSPDPAVNKGYRLYGSAIRRPNDRETYTNFFIVSTRTVGQEKLLNRDDPERSLILHYGLPAKDSLSPHPGTPIVAKFRNSSDILYRDIVSWTKELAFPVSNYGINFTPTTTTAPAK